MKVKNEEEDDDDEWVHNKRNPQIIEAGTFYSTL